MHTAIAALALFPALAFGQVPAQLAYQGRLVDATSGSPMAGVVSLTFAIYGADTGGAPLWSAQQSIALTDGYYGTLLDGSSGQNPDNTFPANLFDGTVRFLGVTVGAGAELTPRQRIGSVPYAITAGSVQGGAVNASTLSIGGTTVIDATGHLVGPAASGTGLQEAEKAHLASTVVTGANQADVTASGGQVRYGAGSGTTGSAGELFGETAVESGAPLGSGLTRVSFRLKVTNNSATSVLANVNCAAMRAGSTTWTPLGSIDVHPADFPANLTWATYTLVCDWRPDDADQFVGVDAFALGITDLFIDYLQFQPVVESTTGLVSFTNFTGPANQVDYRNNTSVGAAGVWRPVPLRTLTFVKRYPTSKLKVTYQDTLGTYGTNYDGCEWQILLDTSAVTAFSAADSTRPAVTWAMDNGAHVAWTTASAGSHTVSVQTRGMTGAGAWGGGITECLMGWNTCAGQCTANPSTSTSFLSVEEIP